MSAKTTGAQPNGGAANGSAQHRSHNDGSAGRAYTVEQKTAVLRVRKCSPTAFYDILGLESEKKTIDDGGIKRAYRKLSLLTHPDKNGYEGADEAFKMVSRAFQILSDPEKKKRYDQFGTDPDNRFSSSSTASPFSGFARSPGMSRGQGGGIFEEELSPEDLFRQFFGGGLGGGFGGPFGGGMFDAGPGFVFNLGGGPGIRVHQFGGGRPRRRPPGAQARAGEGEQQGAGSVLQSLLPMLLLFLLPLVTSFFSSSSSSTSTSTDGWGFPFGNSRARVPLFRLDKAETPLTEQHVSKRYRVPYFVNPVDVSEYTPAKWATLDNVAEQTLFRRLRDECEIEQRKRDYAINDARGWFVVDYNALREAQSMELRSCMRLNDFAKLR